MKQKTYLDAWYEAISFRNSGTDLSVKVSIREKSVFVLDYFGNIVKVFHYDNLF